MKTSIKCLPFFPSLLIALVKLSEHGACWTTEYTYLSKFIREHDSKYNQFQLNFVQIEVVVYVKANLCDIFFSSILLSDKDNLSGTCKKEGSNCMHLIASRDSGHRSF